MPHHQLHPTIAFLSLITNYILSNPKMPLKLISIHEMENILADLKLCCLGPQAIENRDSMLRPRLASDPKPRDALRPSLLTSPPELRPAEIVAFADAHSRTGLRFGFGLFPKTTGHSPGLCGFKRSQMDHFLRLSWRG
ncbi:hypothetical protein TorRG33x02_027380 [Trema orientale]|uniref:Uncharacterized protein n=1 Tax=Trema orientale TaxID=63057 RepID=A0A2P5FUH3_TREOI|nr:hypothetical protein TorRG33x02_027380 [Trema orientale]